MRHDRMASELPTGQIACSGIFEDGKPCYVFEALLTVWTRSPVFEYDELVEVDGVEGV